MSLSHLLMVVVDDEKEMANRYRKYLQRSGFNSNTSFTDSLLTFSYILKIIDYILLLQVGKYHMCNIKRFAEKIKRQKGSKMNLIMNIQCSKMMVL